MVVDNPTYAWRNSTQSCLTQLHADLVIDYRELLDIAAIEAIGPVLATVWEERGYRVAFGTEDEVQHRPNQPADAIYHAVWDEAASRLDPELLVKAADLGDIQATYRD